MADNDRPARSNDVEQRVRAYYDAVDAGDFVRLVSLFAPDCVYRRPGYEPIRGHEELTRFYDEVRVIESGAHTLSDVIVRADVAAVEGSFTGHLRDGRDVTLGFAEFFRLSEGLISERTTYFFSPAV